jgi:hypothetical protein
MQWQATLTAYPSPVFGTLPVSAIDTDLVLKVLESIWESCELATSVVIAAVVHPSVAIPNRITAVVVATVAANEEDLATMKSVSHYVLVHDMPVEVCTVPGTWHCPEADGTGLSGVHAPDMAA